MNERQLAENSYWFAQFMAYYMVLQLVKTQGVEATLKFVDKKFKDIGNANPEFIVKAKEITTMPKERGEGTINYATVVAVEFPETPMA